MYIFITSNISLLQKGTSKVCVQASMSMVDLRLNDFHLFGDFGLSHSHIG